MNVQANTKYNSDILAAYRQVLDMVGLEDWHAIHQSFRNQVLAGEISDDIETLYKEMVEEMATEREAH